MESRANILLRACKVSIMKVPGTLIHLGYGGQLTDMKVDGEGKKHGALGVALLNGRLVEH